MKAARTAAVALLATFWLAATACTYVTGKVYDDKFACLDEDGDQAVKDAENCEDEDIPDPIQDCDDDNDARSEGFEEVPYDGIDNDCDGDNLDALDLDGDGFPGIAAEDWTSADGATTWPDTLESERDCDDTNNQVFPNANTEVPYDGVDSNCDGADDYDFDGDGHVPPADRLPEGSPAYAGSLPQDDCDDDDDTSFPGSTTPDVFYDGVDHDCAGNNDFDADGDTWMPDEYTEESEAYLFAYGYTYTENFGDCDDTAAAIFPGAADTWYDNVDSDCAGNDDYDQDADGFVPDDGDLPLGAVTPYPGALPQGDCDDTASTIGPGALEILGDTADQDCDGDNDSTAFFFHDYDVVGPRRPAVGDTDFHFLLAIVADTFDGVAERGSVLELSKDAITARTEPDAVQNFEPGGTLPVGNGVALLAESDVFYIVNSYERQGDSYLRFHKYEWLPAPFNQYNDTSRFSNAGLLEDYNDFDIVRDPGSTDLWMAACGKTGGTGVLHYVRVAETVGFQPAEQYADTLTDLDDSTEVGNACFLGLQDGDDPVLYAFDDPAESGTTAFDMTSTEFVVDGANTEFTDYDVYDVTRHHDLVVFSGGSDGSGCGGKCVTVTDGTDTWELLDSDVVISADAVMVGNTLYVVALIDSAVDHVVFLYGDPDATMTEVDLPYEHPDLTLRPTGVAIEVDDTHVFIAASGDNPGAGNDGMGWLFMGR